MALILNTKHFTQVEQYINLAASRFLNI